MKKIVILIFLGLLLVSCDKIETPNQKPPAVYNCISPLTQIVKTNTTTSNFRKVLLEDYTGHTCPNCPRAAESAELLLSRYNDSIVVIANHVSATFAAPKTLTYKEDFRNTASEEWDKVQNFGMSNAGLPKGMVNRQKPFAQNHSAWASLIPIALNKPQTVKLDLISYYDPSSHYLSVKIKTTFKKTWINPVNLIVILTQDSIIGQQKDGAPPSGSITDPNDPSNRLNYQFDHIVVESINGTWGQLIKNSPTENDTLTIQNSCYLLNKCFTLAKDVCLNDKKINVVAFAYDVSTKEILQVEKLKIR